MSVFLRGGIWQYDFVINGERSRGSTGFCENEKKKALDMEAELKVQARQGHSIEMVWEQTKRKMISSNNVPVSFDSVWDAFSAKAMSDAKVERKKIYASHIQSFVEWLNQKHPSIRTVGQATSEHAKEYINVLRSADGANSTKNDKLATLKMLFDSLGRSAGVIENPFGGIKKLPMNKISREIYSAEELKKIGDNATGWIYSLCLTALCTGLREGDICLLKKSSVDLKKGWISIPRIEKTGKPLELPILPALAAHMSEIIPQHNSEYVYPELAEKYLKDPSGIGADIKKFFADIGIENTTKEIKGYAKKVSAKDVHSFRHTFVYLAALNGIPFPIVQSIVGHASPAMTKIYMDHAGRTDKAKYFEQLPSYLAKENDTKTPPEDDFKGCMMTLVESLTPENLDSVKEKLLCLLRR